MRVSRAKRKIITMMGVGVGIMGVSQKVPNVFIYYQTLIQQMQYVTVRSACEE